LDEEFRSARASLIRTGLLYAALLVLDIAVIVLILFVRTSNFAFVTLAFVAIVGVLLAFQVVQHARDMRSRLAETEGVVVRKWRRADLVIAMQSHYLTVESGVFRVRPEAWIHVDEGDYVKIVHFPHTLTVVSIHGGGIPLAPVE
jgi:xanthosine utilization system XapX-like protein